MLDREKLEVIAKPRNYVSIVNRLRVRNKNLRYENDKLKAEVDRLTGHLEKISDVMLEYCAFNVDRDYFESTSQKKLRK